MSVSNNNEQRPDRPLHLVTLTVHTEPREVQYRVYADNPEHAIEKGKERLGPGMIVTNATAVKIS
jgi:hypothetical protein